MRLRDLSVTVSENRYVNIGWAWPVNSDEAAIAAARKTGEPLAELCLNALKNNEQPDGVFIRKVLKSGDLRFSLETNFAGFEGEDLCLFVFFNIDGVWVFPEEGAYKEFIYACRQVKYRLQESSLKIGKKKYAGWQISFRAEALIEKYTLGYRIGEIPFLYKIPFDIPPCKATDCTLVLAPPGEPLTIVQLKGRPLILSGCGQI
jgi:hypothetical protein